MGVRLDEDEAWAFLEASHTGILASLRADGAPAVVPMWFVVLDRVVYLRTLASSAKAGHVRRDPRVSFLVETGRAWSELKAVVVHATATAVDDAGVRAEVDAAFDAKYAGHRTPEDVPAATKRHYAAPRVYLRLDPRGRPLTWDNSRVRRATP